MSNKASQLVPFVLVVLFISSCKKGDEDPFFTLLSRKNRITGNWTVTSINGSTYYEGETQPWNTIEGDEEIIESNYSIPQEKIDKRVESIIEYSIEINKDGTWSQIRHVLVEHLRDDGSYRSTTSFEQFEQVNGKWMFMRKSKGEFKNKERILFEILRDSSFYSNQDYIYDDYGNGAPLQTGTYENGGIYEHDYAMGLQNFTVELIKLEKKEMKWRLDNSNSFFYAELDSNYTSNSISNEETIIVFSKN